MREYSIDPSGGLEFSLPKNLTTILSGIGEPSSYGKGDEIYRQGEDADHVFFLLCGRVKATLFAASGQESILRIHLRESILGLTALSSNPVRDANATCLDPVSLVQVKRVKFLDLMRDEPEFGIHVVRLLADRMSDFHYRVGDWLTQPVEQRLSRALLALSIPDEGSDNRYAQDIPLTHEELAQLINTRRPTLSNALSKLANLGFVKQSGRKLVIADRVRLRAHTLALNE